MVWSMVAYRPVLLVALASTVERFRHEAVHGRVDRLIVHSSTIGVTDGGGCRFVADELLDLVDRHFCREHFDDATSSEAVW